MSQKHIVIYKNLQIGRAACKANTSYPSTDGEAWGSVNGIGFGLQAQYNMLK